MTKEKKISEQDNLALTMLSLLRNNIEAQNLSCSMLLH